ncbi:MAG: 50S ribosomal protein L33 [Candidatus Omnitrophica bacterium]|nr:50S ribosomal protein L33 [Candidatus Omnitrophota bacterium]
MREPIQFQCTECKRINYSGMKDKKKHPERIELSKYCPSERKHTPHKEMKK